MIQNGDWCGFIPPPTENFRRRLVSDTMNILRIPCGAADLRPVDARGEMVTPGVRRPQASVVGMLIPFTSFGAKINMTPLPGIYFAWLALTLVCYCVLTQLVKLIYIRRYGRWL